MVLIQAGQYIDSTLGVSLGLATMTAAAAGQVVSDVSGVVFGGTLERFLLQLSLIETPNLTSAQRRLSVCRNVSMAGAVCGVIVGCALGATTLLLVDLDKRRRIERAQQLREIVSDMIALQDDNGDADDDKEEGSSLRTESCCIYVANADDFQIDAADYSTSDPKQQSPWRSSLKLLSSQYDASAPTMAQECASKQKVLLSPDRSILYVPVREDDQVLAVLELIKRQTPELRGESEGHNNRETLAFSKADVRTAKVLAKHLAIFMNRLVE